MQDDFSYNQEQKDAILDCLQRIGIALEGTIEDQFLNDTAGYVRVALAFRKTVKEQGDSWRNEDKRIRKNFRNNVLNPLKQALDGFRNLGTEDQMWVGPGFLDDDSGVPHPWQRDLAAMVEMFDAESQAPRGRPPNAPIGGLIKTLANLWFRCTGVKPTLEQDSTRAACSPFLDYCRAAIGPTDLGGEVESEHYLVHHVRYEIEGRNLVDEEQDHPTES